MSVALNPWPFFAVTVPLVFSPGPSTAVVLRNGIAGGVRAGPATAIGANTGSISYGALSAFGVSLALQRWPAAWIALRAGGMLAERPARHRARRILEALTGATLPGLAVKVARSA